MRTIAENGLTSAGVAQNRQRFGTNRLTPLPREPLWRKFLAKFNEPIIKILLAAALLSFVTGLALGHTLVEGLAVMVAVILATGVAFLSEYQSDREFEVLNAHKDSLRVKVMRDGVFHTISLEEVVCGDAVLLEAGDEIPADGRLVRATELSIDQSLMTGESNAVRKQARPADDTAEGTDQPGCLYRGTQVVDGVGMMLVTAVGDATALGQIARRLSADPGDEAEDGAADSEGKRVQRKLTISKELTPLQQKLEKLAALISRVGYVAAGLIFLAQLIRGLIHGDIYWPASLADVVQVFGVLLDYFVLMVIIIVVAVPEGLPMSVTVSLALAMRKMTRANSLVRQLVACETIGSATVICSDKTGTLTQNKMRVVRLGWEDKVYDRDGDWPKLEDDAGVRAMLSRPFSTLPLNEGQEGPRKHGTLSWLALNAAVNSTANLEEKEGKPVVVGNSTEGALLHWLADNDLPYAKLRLQFPAIYQIHFSSDRKRMTTVISYGERLVALVKGAPEWVLPNSTHYLAADGSVREWTPALREAVEANLRDTSARAMRSLAFGYALLEPATPDDLHAHRDALESGLIYTGFIAIRDPLREDVKDALDQCRRAGIEVKMVTGDNVETARAIGFDIGLIDHRDEPIDTDHAAVLTSPKFNALSDDELKTYLPKLRILARAKPLDKYRLVRLLQELGEVVAVTGDGTNDAPALKKADVGLAMGIAGTEVAKEASKIVLLDDSFATIVKAVHWGRSLYENIQRFIQFQVTINLSALTIAFLGPLLFGVKTPFSVLQLLWINVIMDTFASIAFCSEPPRPGLMDLPPKRRDENILTKPMLRTIFLTATFFVVTMLGLLVLMKNGWFAEDEPRTEGTFTLYQGTIFFTVYVFFQVWNQINCRSLVPRVSGFHRLLANPTFLTIAATTALGQVLIVTFGGAVFRVEPLGPLAWLGVLAFTASVLVFAEIARRVRLAIKGDVRT